METECQKPIETVNLCTTEVRLEESHVLIVRTNDKNYLPVNKNELREVLRDILREELPTLLKKEKQPESGSLTSSCPKILSLPAPETTGDMVSHEFRTRFERLCAQWKEDTEFASTVLEMATHPAYQQIIGMGQSAIPLIIERLERYTEHWFWALAAITGENPVPEQSRGKVEQMRATWLEWASVKGYGSKRRCQAKRAS